MSSSDFQKVTEAFSGQGSALEPPLPSVEKVTILGGGPEARALACLCLSEGATTTLFSAYGAELNPIRKAGSVTIRGAGPVGTYQVDQAGIPAIRLTAELDAAVSGADMIFVTGPVLKQRTYSMVLAGHLRDGQVLVLVPGRSLGAIEMAWYLRVGGETAEVSIVELQDMPFWIRSVGNTLHLSKPPSLAAAVLPSHHTGILKALQQFFPDLQPVQNVVRCGFSDASGLVEVVALLCGGPGFPEGGVALPAGAEPLPVRNVFRKLLGPRHLLLLASLAAERRLVAARWGIRDLPDTETWIEQYAGSEMGAGSRPLPDESQAVAMIRCAVIGSLVPLVSAARLAGVEVPVTQALIEMARASLGGDLVNAGRRLDAIGIPTGNLDEARKILEARAQGNW